LFPPPVLLERIVFESIPCWNTKVVLLMIKEGFSKSSS